MNSETRQIAIYDMIKTNREMSVNTLAQCFGVSAMTIRRDLDQLERSKLIERAYGKARIADESKIELSYSMRKSMNLASKQKIALQAIQPLRLPDDGLSRMAILVGVAPVDAPSGQGYGRKRGLDLMGDGGQVAGEPVLGRDGLGAGALKRHHGLAHLVLEPGEIVLPRGRERLRPAQGGALQVIRELRDPRRAPAPRTRAARCDKSAARGHPQEKRERGHRGSSMR